nr:EOG090X05JJ [Triops cancriformis]
MPSLIEAIDEKYNNTDEESFGFIVHIPRISPRKRLPSILVLENCDIDKAGEEQEISEKCRGVRELDLAHNSLNSWEEVFKILRQLQGISFLNLSFNHLNSPVLLPDVKLASLNQLVLNNTHVEWHSIFSLLQLAPNLSELHLSLNDLKCEKCLPAWVQPHENVRTVYFNSNYVENRDDLRFLDRLFPSLEHLYLVDCPVWTLVLGKEEASRLKQERRFIDLAQTELEASSSTSPTVVNSPTPSVTCVECQSNLTSIGREEEQIFSRLQHLWISNCHIESWEEVDSLNSWPVLKDLRLLNCPLFRGYTQHERRQFTIARLPKLVKLNGGLISAKEREESERAFIRYYDSKPEGPKPGKYHELLEAHGPLCPLVELNLKPQTEVLVLVRWKESQFQKRITVYQTVGEFKSKLREVAGLPSSKIRLFYIDQGMKEAFGPEEMKFPNKQLYSYNIRDGDEFLIDSKI